MTASANPNTNFNRSLTAMLRTADEVSDVIPQLVPIYQTAFAGEPWFEVARCAPEVGSSCAGQISEKQKIGETCTSCGEVLRLPAHSTEVLRERWISRFEEHESRLYLERLEDGTCLVATLAWRATPQTLAAACYAGPGEGAVHGWLADELPASFVWMEEIFAHLALRPTRNLWNYEGMVRELLAEMDSSAFVFRTINPHLIRKTMDLFGPAAQRFASTPDPKERDVLIVRPGS